MTVQEPPVAGGERAGVIADPDRGPVAATTAVVAHPVDVGTAAGVRLGGDLAAVRVLRHAHHVRHHDPVVPVDEGAVEPVGHLRRIPTPLHRIVSQHHQPGNVVHPTVVPEIGQDRRQAARLDGVGIQFGEPGGNVAVGVQRVAGAVVRAEVPVQVPDVVPPTDQLPDEALHRGDRQIVLATGGLDPAHQLERIEQPEIQRTGHQGMRQPGIAGQHRVLVGSEGRQAVVDEVLERGQRLAPGGGEPARAVDPDEGDITVAPPSDRGRGGPRRRSRPPPATRGPAPRPR